MSYLSRLYNHRNAQSPEVKNEKPFFSKKHKDKNSSKEGLHEPKLSVNEPDDSYEKEADAVANTVVNKSAKKQVVQQNKISSIQRLATTPEEEKVGTNDGRMERDKEKPFQVQMKSAGEEKIKEDDKMKKPMPVQKKSEGNAATTSQPVSSKIESSKGKGNKLSQKSLHEMNSSFGTDFSNVRIHNDSESAEMNKELHAQAFTHGDDIFFNSGKYNPENSEGKFLLAHELTHTIQQGKEGGAQKKIQRSFWGTLGGAVAGGVAGFFLGGGPIGAILGATGGVAGGGIVGDALTTDTRPLNEVEIAEARKVFGSSLDYDKIKVSDSSTVMTLGGPARTPFNTIYFPSGTLDSNNYYPWMIHELTHTWQTQHGVSVLTKIGTALGGESSYDFGEDDGLRQAIIEGKCFNDFNTEQQGDILEMYYKISVGIKSGDLSVYEYFVHQVQYSDGNSTTDILDPKYRPASDSDEQMA